MENKTNETKEVTMEQLMKVIEKKSQRRNEAFVWNWTGTGINS